MTRVRRIASAGLLIMSLVQISFGGTISGSRTGTITGSRTGTITGSRTGTITGSRVGVISEGIGESRQRTQDEFFAQLILILMNSLW